jgi:hypothetical protein
MANSNFCLDPLLLEEGDYVYYSDEYNIRTLAIVTHVQPESERLTLANPKLCLYPLHPKRGFFPKPNVERAFHDGIRWITLNKWHLRDEIPKEHFATLQ